jgi:hypothetical protein
MSEQITDDRAGLNGGFEFAQSGLPVNWLMYTPKTVPEGDFMIVLDTVDFTEGKQSLKFVVNACSSNGGWHSPGFCKEFPADPGTRWKISFRIKNSDSRFLIRIGGVGSSSGKYETIIHSGEKMDTWQEIDYRYTIPEKMNRLRIEVSILEPGIFWIDDIRITEV